MYVNFTGYIKKSLFRISLCFDHGSPTGHLHDKYNRKSLSHLEWCSYSMEHRKKKTMSCLPIRDNLDQRDINLHSVRCSVCDEGQETSHRVIIECNIAREVCFL